MKSLQITKSSVKGNLLTSGEGKYNEPTTKVKHSKSLWVIDTILWIMQELKKSTLE